MAGAPRGRQRNVSGAGKGINRRGSGLGTGRVGSSGGYSGRPGRTGGSSGGSLGGGSFSSGGSTGGSYSSGGGRRVVRSSGGGGLFKLIVLVIILLVGGGSGLSGLFSGGSDYGNYGDYSDYGDYGNYGDYGVDLSTLLGSLGGGSISSGWDSGSNAGVLNTVVDASARDKYTKILGNGRDEVTLMIYLCGTDLESRSKMATSDIQEMIAADISDDVNVIVYTGGCKSWQNNAFSSSTNQIWQVTDKGVTCLEKNLGSKSMTDEDTLSSFIKWCAKKYPANRNMLVMWDHGGGSVSGFGYDEKFASSGSMDLAEIDQALKAGGVKFDFVGFDACLMATAENALMLTEHADYLIASEETEPGIGWYYTDWLTALSENTSISTLELGKIIIDDFVTTCAQKCQGQSTTLSIVDLAEYEALVPAALADFSKETSAMIRNNEYATVSNARNGAREFGSSSKIDQVDLVHLAKNMGTAEGKALAEVLLNTVKYNRTSSNMTNSYGISIYFPFRKASMVDTAVETYEEIGMDEEYMRCIQEFASMEVSGQAVSGGTTTPVPSLTGGYTIDPTEMINQMLGSFLGGNVSNISGLSSSNIDFLFGRSLSENEIADYLRENSFDGSYLTWSRSSSGYAISLPQEEWELVQSLHANLFFDEGAGYIDMGLDNVYDFDNQGNLLAPEECTWIAINEQPVAYYHESTVDDGVNYSIIGRVPVLYNGERAELILEFTDKNPYGSVVGVRRVYAEGETTTVAKTMDTVKDGDVIDFLCDYYSYDGEYLDSYMLGEQLVVDGELTISDVYVDEDRANFTYRFTDIYNQTYWTEPLTW